MRKLNNLDTIAAISTAIGEAGIGIVRLSGKNALKIADKVFTSKSKTKPSKFKTYTTHYGKIIDNSRVIDEVILTIMRAPKSYTKEDVVEINCHSGIVPLRRILDLVIKCGARLSDPGEFTQRAFLSGRIDLAQAEAVLDIIRAKTDESLEVGFKQLSGALSEEINKLRDELIEILAELEAKIDFPDDVAFDVNYKKIISRILKLEVHLNEEIENSSHGKVLREGLNVVICGCPNVGKSSLLNLLLREEKAIVTAVAGTTRDAVEDIINIRGIPLKIFDTAGILEPRDVIEDLAVKKAHSLINDADLVILVIDGNRKLTKKDLGLINRLKDKVKIGVINKIDLAQRIRLSKLNGQFNKVVKISATKGTGLKTLESAIEQLVWKGKVISKNKPFFTNVRHINLLRDCLKFLSAARESANNKLSMEVVALDLKESIKSLDKITGRAIESDLLDKIFSEFCIGK